MRHPDIVEITPVLILITPLVLLVGLLLRRLVWG